LRIFSVILLAAAVSACSTVSFKQLSLYDSVEVPEVQQRAEKIFFKDAAGTMWNSLFDCGDFEVTKSVAYKGNASIKLSWDKSKGCEWIGFGNSYSNWAATNVADYQENSALSFYVRTQKNTARGIPIVLGLEDFSGGGTYLFTEAKNYLYGLEIDTTWKQMIIPMWHFATDPNDSRNDNVDITAIKQLKFQLEGAGSFYLDEIVIIDYTKEDFAKMRAEVELMKPKGNINQLVYREGELKEDAWATGETLCQTLEERTDIDNNTYIYWKFDAEDCDWAKWGINWNDWYQINFRGIEEDAKLQFKIKASVETKFKIVVEDFNGNSAQLFSSFSIDQNQTDWQTINIALKDFNMKESGMQVRPNKTIFVCRTYCRRSVFR
jgi:hypothetical protein